MSSRRGGRNRGRGRNPRANDGGHDDDEDTASELENLPFEFGGSQNDHSSDGSCVSDITDAFGGSAVEYNTRKQSPPDLGKSNDYERGTPASPRDSKSSYSSKYSDRQANKSRSNNNDGAPKKGRKTRPHNWGLSISEFHNSGKGYQDNTFAFGGLKIAEVDDESTKDGNEMEGFFDEPQPTMEEVLGKKSKTKDESTTPKNASSNNQPKRGGLAQREQSEATFNSSIGDGEFTNEDLLSGLMDLVRTEHLQTDHQPRGDDSAQSEDDDSNHAGEQMREAGHNSEKSFYSESNGNSHEDFEQPARRRKGVRDVDNNSMESSTRTTRTTRTTRSGRHKKIDFLKDNPREMTYGRQIALCLMKRYKWYNPRLEEDRAAAEEDHDDDDLSENTAWASYRSNDGFIRNSSQKEAISLERAWAYFEHYTLARYIVTENELKKEKKVRDLKTRIINRFFKKGDVRMDVAARGENTMPTKMYHPVFTPHTQLGDWGIGVGLYFAALRAFCFISLLAGILNIPNFLYFGSDNYSGGTDQSNVEFLLRGSAVCTNTKWVPCVDCKPKSPDYTTRNGGFEFDRLGYSYNEYTKQNVTFALRNFCNGATREQGLINYGTLILILASLILFNRYVQIMEVYFDEDEQTTQDYSITIENPPEDAVDPEEWKDYFSEAFNAYVTCCTVAVANDSLIRKLVERRECLQKIERMLDPGTPMDMTSLAGIVARQDRKRNCLTLMLASILPGIPELFRRVIVLTADIRGLAQMEYPATRVFVTFEKEIDQRRVLADLALGRVHAWTNNRRRVKDKKHLFRGDHILIVHEAEEPNVMRWLYMNEPFWIRLIQQTATTFVTWAAILIVGMIIYFINSSDLGSVGVAMAISLSNCSFPEFAKILTRMESHATETAFQTSLYFKIVCFRWVITSIVITIVTPFTSSLSYDSAGLLPKIYALFISEIVTLNVFQVGDPWGNFQRHFLAPRGNSQDEMNINMRGVEVEMAERYTNITKIVFLAWWYSSIYPGGFFMCAIALGVNYFTDRHSLMRTWKRSPQLGSNTSEFSRRYFLNLSFLAMSVMSSYFWACFPFDNLCEIEDSFADDTMWGNRTIRFDPHIKDKEEEYTDIGPTTHMYKFCLQDFWHIDRSNTTKFPFLSEMQPEGGEWMTSEQELLADMYGWTSICMLVFMALIFIQSFWNTLIEILFGDHTVIGDDQGEDFSERQYTSCYIPQVDSNVYAYPLIVGNIDRITEDMIDWTDPFRPHDFYDLTRDAEKILKGLEQQKVFSQVGHWPPPEPDCI